MLDLHTVAPSLTDENIHCSYPLFKIIYIYNIFKKAK